MENTLHTLEAVKNSTRFTWTFETRGERVRVSLRTVGAANETTVGDWLTAEEGRKEYRKVIYRHQARNNPETDRTARQMRAEQDALGVECMW